MPKNDLAAVISEVGGRVIGTLVFLDNSISGSCRTYIVSLFLKASRGRGAKDLSSQLNPFIHLWSQRRLLPFAAKGVWGDLLHP